MREPNRIENFTKELAKIWKENFPDWRFGQLMVNLVNKMGDPFYWEEDDFLKQLEIFVNEIK